MFFDPMYFLILGPAMILAGVAQWRVKRAYADAQRYRPVSGMSGADAARQILSRNGLNHVRLEPAQGFLSDHYDPRSKTLRLSPDVFRGSTLAAVGIAAHEAGHALQDAKGYAPLKLRNGIVPLASIGSRLSVGIFMLGVMISFFAGRRVLANAGWGPGQYLMFAAILLFSATVVFQLINLPVEFDASRRARRVLIEQGIIASAEDRQVGRVLNAAALTYVAATLSAILTLLYLLMRSGLLGGSRD